jgi:hypothetical protein
VGASREPDIAAPIHLLNGTRSTLLAHALAGSEPMCDGNHLAVADACRTAPGAGDVASHAAAPPVCARYRHKIAIFVMFADQVERQLSDVAALFTGALASY